MYAVWELREHSGPPSKVGPDTFDEAYARASTLRNDFYVAVRAVFANGDVGPLEPTSTY